MRGFERCGCGGKNVGVEEGRHEGIPAAAAAGLVVEYVYHHAPGVPVAHAATSELGGAANIRLLLATARGTSMHNDGASWRRSWCA